MKLKDGLYFGEFSIFLFRQDIETTILLKVKVNITFDVLSFTH